MYAPRKWNRRARNQEIPKLASSSSEHNSGAFAFAGDEQRVLFEAILSHESRGVLACDSQGSLIYINPVARRLTGLEPGSDLCNLPDGRSQFLSEKPGPADAGHSPVESVLQGAQLEASDHRLVLADGQEVVVEISGAPLHAADGHLLGAVFYLVEDNQHPGQSAAELDRPDVTGAHHTALEAQLNQRTNELDLANLRLRAVLAALPLGVLMTDAEGHLLMANQIYEKLMGGRLPGRDGPVAQYLVRERFAAGRWTQNQQELQHEDWPVARALQGETILSAMIDIERYDGQHMTILSGGAPVMDEQGRLLGTVTVAQDISEQRRLESSARAAARDARRWAVETDSIFNALTDAVVVYNPDGRVRMANPLAIAMFGFDPLHFPREVVARRLLNTPVEGLPSSRAEQGEILVNERMSFTNPRGRSYTALVSASPMFIKNELTGVVEVWRDVTEREKLMAELDFEKRRLLALMESAPAGILFTDAHGELLLVNPAAQVLAGGQISGNVFSPIQRGKAGQADDSYPRHALAEVLRSGKPVKDVEQVFARPDETEIVLLVNSAPVLDEEGRTIGAVAVTQDISRRKQAEQELREVAARERARAAELEQFAFIASHDLQEPLRKVRYFGERLKEHFTDTLSEQEIDFLNRMLNASQRMQSMINDLLTYSRITTKAQPFELVDLNQVASEVLNDLEVRIDRSRAKVTVDPLPVIEADPMQMRQLLQNLISNALKFHRPETPPEIRLYSRPVKGAGHSVEILVEDNGIGFPTEQLDRILQPFERLHGRSEYEGSGMGLAICRKIVERHRGEITAESAPGQGTTFIVRLPQSNRQQPASN